MSFRKATLFAGTMLVTTLGAAAAMAQANPPPCPTNRPHCNEPVPQPDVIVTGSRIPHPNLQQPAPVAVVTQQLIQNAGTPDLGNIIAELPSMGVQGTVRANSNSFGNAGGLSFADLRNLGVSRTLTLVDGDRHVAADPGSMAVDLGSIPPALVDRVEVVTGGASAIYGSDAIAGVVNIITKRNFVGVQGQEQGGGFPNGNYGWNQSGYLTVGRNFASDRGNVNVTLIWDSNQQILANQVPGLHNYGTIINPGSGPQFLVVPNVESEFINNTGVLLNANTFEIPGTFTPNGTLIPQQTRVGSNSFAFGSFFPDCTTCFRGEDYELIQPKTDRIGGDFRFTYEITPHLRFSVDEKLIQREIYDFNQPSIDFFGNSLQTGTQLLFIVSPDNAFIPPGSPLAAIINNPAGDPIAVDRFLGDGGPRYTIARRITNRIVPRFDGDFDGKFAQINWDASFNWGETTNYISNRGILLPGNFNAAFNPVIDPATGQPACRLNVPSAPPDPFAFLLQQPQVPIVGNPAACVPYNPFGEQNSRAAINWSRTNTWEYQRLDQEVASLNFTFDTSRFFNLQGGPIGIAGGLEWRKERVVDNQDPLVSEGLTEIAPVPNFAGGFEVTEGYVEVNLPLLKHRPFADELTFDLADRNAQYTTVGNVNAWKATGIWGPFPGLKFRATYSQAVRAPNLTEAFLPPSGTFFTVNDPCDKNQINVNVNRAANCAALGIPAGFTANTNLSPPGIEEGNPHLTPEQSNSYTVGLVWQPPFVHNFSLTVDYYNITIKNAILLPSADNIADNCVDATGGPDLTFCNLLQRNPTTHDIVFVTDTYLNASELFTDGVEIQATYGFWTDPMHLKFSTTASLPGRVTLNADFNYLMHLHNFPFQTVPNQYTVLEGAPGSPYMRALASATYAQGPWTVDWTVRFVGTSADFNRSPGQAAYAGMIIAPPYFKAEVYNDVVVRYRLPTKTGTAELFAGANDLFNVPPPPNAVTGNNGGPDGSALYDLGIYVFAGARIRY